MPDAPAYQYDALSDAGDCKSLRIDEEGNLSAVEWGEDTEKISKQQWKQAFTNARKRECNVLTDNPKFLPTPIHDVHEGIRELASRLLDELKRAQKCFRRKSRLRSQGYNDDEEPSIVTKSLEIQSSSELLGTVLQLSALNPSKFWRDIAEGNTVTLEARKRRVY